MLLEAADRIEALRLRRAGFLSRTVPTSVGRIHLWEGRGTGQAPPLVALHGVAASATELAPLLHRLRSGAGRVFALDLPGHGWSDDPPDGLTRETLIRGLREAIDAVLDEPAYVFGNSLGGLAAIRLAQERSERVRGLILCSPGGAAAEEAELERFLEQFRMARWRDARRFVDRLHAGSPWYGPLIARGVRRRFQRPPLRAFLEGIRPGDLLDPEEVAAVPDPTWVVFGRADVLMPPAHRAFFRAHLPAHAHLDEPPHLGHCPYLDRPGHLAETVLRFLRWAEER